MTSEELKKARNALGLSAMGLARKLGMDGRWDDRTVRRWESGQHPVPDHVVKAVKEMINFAERQRGK